MKEIPFHESITPLERVILTFSLVVGVFMAILDTTIVDIIVPKLTAPLSTDIYGAQWVITSYMTASAVGILMVEHLERLLGLKKVFILGLTFFTVASLFCGQANSLEFMVFWRAVQGLGEAFIVISAESLLFSAYAPEKRGVAMGIYGLGVSFAPALGPTLGGWLTEHLNWRFVFYINVPIGILNILLTLLFVKEYRTANKHQPFNVVSFLFLATATVSLLIVLSKGQQLGWFSSDFILWMACLSTLSFLLFLLSELSSEHPLVDFSTLKVKEFLVSLFVYCFVLGFSMYQVFYLIPLYFENLKQIGTFQTGLAILPMALTIGMSSPIAGALADKKSPLIPLSIAIPVYLFSSLYLIPKADFYMPTAQTKVYLVILAVGMGFFFAPITLMALNRVGEEKRTLAVSFMHYIRFVGGSFGTAMATNHLQGYMWENFQRTSEIQEHFYILEYLKAVPETIFYNLQVLFAYSNAFKMAFTFAGLWAVPGLLALLLLFKPKSVLSGLLKVRG
ncbi:DHA2 family efflux MFS transporter permease subunit [Thermocrinis minervae]|uniref:MFS transporter, DHA2 family, multidrug resistance protein n=1 Tax=Thermocrinis minervae TaxID=381751 RepID=A0A1M6R5M2_9AQUI|nr:DHA2 family efflux MFS transporter permease subunit [Thermocrinis minervae]SHK27743.1 MFS transporter, DHA2 family, multidrug resistance protein [Thermocrinis minervae]